MSGKTSQDRLRRLEDRLIEEGLRLTEKEENTLEDVNRLIEIKVERDHLELVANLDQAARIAILMLSALVVIMLAIIIIIVLLY